jgi:HSP20 family protein
MAHFSDDPFQVAQREIERLFRDLVYTRLPASHFTGEPWIPLADLMVSDRHARVIVELAGVPHDAVRVRLHGKRLEVSGRREAPQEIGDACYHRAEIYFGEFRRVIELPWEADLRTVQALYHDGLLEIRLQPMRTRSRSRGLPARERRR